MCGENIYQISTNPRITQRDLELKTGLSRRGIEENLKKLKVNGIIKRIGPDNGRYWQVL